MKIDLSPVSVLKKSIDIVFAVNVPKEWQPFVKSIDCMDFDRFAYLLPLEHMLS